VTEIHQVARELIAGVGTAVVQAMTGVTDRAAPAAWAEPDGPEPDAEVEQRLRLGHQVWGTVRAGDGPNVALAWLVGSNPRLGEATPVTAIRELRATDALGAAQAFVDDTFG
jgi:hypothetical protein